MMFNSMTSCVNYKDNSVDLSRTKEPIFEYLEPLAVDIASGKILNKSPFRKLVKVGEVDVDADIQSYGADVDIYKIIERYMYSGDSSVLSVRKGMSLDLTNTPDNINDFNDMMRIYSESLKKGDKTIASAILNNNMSDSDIIKLISEKIKSSQNKENTEV